MHLTGSFNRANKTVWNDISYVKCIKKMAKGSLISCYGCGNRFLTGFEKYPIETKDVLTELFLTDVIIEGCASHELRRRILQQDRSLSEIESLWITLEGIESQVRDLNVKPQENTLGQKVFKITAKQNHSQRSWHIPGHFPRNKPHPYNQRNFRCFNCGRRDHISTDQTCPAKNVACRSCKRVGHFEAYCRQKVFQRGYLQRSSTQVMSEKDKICMLKEEGVVSKPDNQKEDTGKTYYTFYAGSESNVIMCNVGGVDLDLLVDSGSDANLIPDTVWEYLKKKAVTVKQCERGSSKILKGQVILRYQFSVHLLLMSRSVKSWFQRSFT
ncbi:uncharacterized protein LOC131679299 [Topomyia yanbarensis]|uniref:uncharacterized protein LOC131679299 n=1 Tax=Topomyia yanbarensis TaxID=2498891 RepID=UPI00273C6EA5|nr:uncharacterized protein LOC131679299 [Topomyia yanbarensis]